ncbi:type VI secretion system tip protein VgrG [Massilia sp. PAMC28688]|uniref:type VI secretion system Vgr family protein n=1 Tax=Massilia sp. PAMC28688 TaxID=2861283 RepID=UPI001C633F4C|nr:type VI secretion system Vgr family protein [Massilia sp. PAMC28688]QYF92053.1 type VI secretion system tip protein VgrG [Massilia sp. PAMC28688]
MNETVDQISNALAAISSASRLYALQIGDHDQSGFAALTVEAFSAQDAVNNIAIRDVIAVSTSAYIDLSTLLSQTARLEVSLADGSRTTFGGEVIEARMLGSEGGLARYGLRLASWMWRLTQARNSRVWQDKTVIDIVEAVFAPYLPAAIWRWSEEVAAFMDVVGQRSYCCQYRETDFQFVRRLLAEEGLSWRAEDTEDGPGIVLFADSTQDSAIGEDASSAADGGIRFHGIGPAERQDTVQAVRSLRSMGASMTTVLSYDYKAKKIVCASSASRLQTSARLPSLESYDVPGQYGFASNELAQRYADLQMEGREARCQLWQGRSTVRTLRAGTRVTIHHMPLQDLGSASFTALRVWSVGVNNLPSKAREGLAELFGPIPELLTNVMRGHEVPDFELVVAQAYKTGYANAFEAVQALVPWRPQLPASDGRSHPRPTAYGSQSAIVVGADGSDTPTGADELYCDHLGRVRIRYHWQDHGDATCWVRVAQRSAGGGMGSQFLPRIGQEVLVQFIDNNIDRPVIVGALYNGQGEGGIVPTPGGQPNTDNQASQFETAADHTPSAQGNIAGGNSPVWHGASADSAGHRNAAAQWGIRSKEFGGNGYNQLLFDDTDAQGRIQLKSSHAGTELNLGHLIHAADNYRGSFRGQGAELRTDDYGAVRAGGGLLITSYKLAHAANARDPAGDNAPGIAMLKQAVTMAKTFSDAAVRHKTVALATHLGAAKANSSELDEKAAPIAALMTAVSGMVGSYSVDAAGADAHNNSTEPTDNKLPHVTDPIIAIAGKAGLGMVAGESVQLANGEAASLMSGKDSQFVTGGQMRVHSGQAIGVLGGAMKAGANVIGLQVVAAKDAINLQAQGDSLTVQARDEVNVVSANGHIDWAAAKIVSLSTAGGANIKIEGGNITVQCPGTITVHAGAKKFTGPERLDYPLASLPRSICVECMLNARASGSPFAMK